MTEPTAATLRELADAFNARDFDRAASLLSDSLEFKDMAAGVTTQGAAGFLAYAGAWTKAFSDMHMETLAVVGDGRYAAGEFIGRGTHDGTLPMPTGDIPPTGRTFIGPFVWFAEFSDGKITGLRDYYDGVSMMVQLGLMPEPAAAQH